MSKNKRLDALGDRLKTLERIETEARFPPNNYLYVRIDGRSFSKFTKNLKRPYDEDFSNIMIQVTEHLVKEFHATIGYTQSDEISLILKNGYHSKCIFKGKKQKIVSTLAAYASAVFNKLLVKYPSLEIDEKAIPTFDCRAFNLPSVDEAANCILWREADATKNSVSMAAQSYFSFNELFKKNTSVMKDMLLTQKNVNWDLYPTHFKYGTYVQRELFEIEGATRSRVIPIDWFDSLKEYEHQGRVQIVMNDYPEKGEEDDST